MSSRLPIACAIVLIAGGSSANAQMAEPLRVQFFPDSGDGWGKDQFGHQYDGLQRAVEAAAGDGIVTLDPGEYLVSLRLPSGSVTLQANPSAHGQVVLRAPECKPQPNAVSPDGLAAACSIVLADRGGHHTLRGITLTGGLGTDGYIFNFDDEGNYNGWGAGSDLSHGGAIACQRTQLLLEGVRLEGNEADLGGGLFAHGCEVVARDLQLTANRAHGWGGGAAVYDTALELTGGAVSHNEAVSNGGGLFAKDASLTLTNLEVSDNRVTSPVGHGGGLEISLSCRLSLINSTVTGNQVVDRGGGLFIYDTHTVAWIVNSIVADNRADQQGSNLYIDRMSHALIDHSCLWDPTTGGDGVAGRPHLSRANVVADPDFEVPPDDGISEPTWRLRPGSPAADAGRPGDEWDDVDGSPNDMGMWGGPQAQR